MRHPNVRSHEGPFVSHHWLNRRSGEANGEFRPKRAASPKLNGGLIELNPRVCERAESDAPRATWIVTMPDTPNLLEVIYRVRDCQEYHEPVQRQYSNE